jgi:polysaccharide biosynthesis protein PslG
MSLPYRRRRGRRARTLAIVVALTTLLLPAGASAAEPGVVPDLTWGTSAATQDRTGAALRDMGARWVRLHVQWRDAEPAKGAYSASRFAEYDRAVDVARAAGSRVVLMAYEAPAWASGSSTSNVPRDPADFAAFMQHLAQRYEGKVAAYEIWNEPGHPRFWSTGRNPAAYTRLLQAAYPAIKAADPSATVLVGGLSSYDYRFLDEIYASGGQGAFDAVALHPYTDCGISPTVTWYDSAGALFGFAFTGYREVRKRMLARGDDKPLWLTEFGWTTTTETCQGGAWTSGVSETAQADYLTMAMKTLESDPYVQVALWYNLRQEDGDRDHVEGRWGLLRSDFTPKPAYAAFKQYATGLPSAPAPTPAADPPVVSEPPAVDAAPSVRLTAPGDRAEVTRRMSLAAVASDDRKVVKVVFAVDGRDLATDTTAPYSASWQPDRRLAYGEHVVTATAHDSAGQRASASVTVVKSPAKASLAIAASGGDRHVARGRVHGAASERVELRLRRRGTRRAVRVRAALRGNGRYRVPLALRPGRWSARAVVLDGRGRAISRSGRVRFQH